MARSTILNIMVQAAMKAGRVLVRDFGEVQNLQASLKGPAHYVNQANKRAQDIIYTELSKARPDYSFLTKETVSEGQDNQHRWLIDPLNGMINYLHGIPLFAVSLALERQGTIVAGVIYNPAMDELYTAERGSGTFLNDHRLRVSARNKLRETIIGTAISQLQNSDSGNFSLELRQIIGETDSVRCFGSTALGLAYVAAGRFDGFLAKAFAYCDISAGMILVREAGGFLSDKNGDQDMSGTKTIIAGNDSIHSALLKLLYNPIP